MSFEYFSNTDTYIMDYLENIEDINLSYFCIPVGIAKWELSEDGNFEYVRMHRNSLGGGILILWVKKKKMSENDKKPIVLYFFFPLFTYIFFLFFSCLEFWNY